MRRSARSDVRRSLGPNVAPQPDDLRALADELTKAAEESRFARKAAWDRLCEEGRAEKEAETGSAPRRPPSRRADHEGGSGS